MLHDHLLHLKLNFFPLQLIERHQLMVKHIAEAPRRVGGLLRLLLLWLSHPLAYGTHHFSSSA